MSDSVSLQVLLGRSGDRQVLLGFAPANLLYSLSYADVLDESGKTGYQRRFASEHSLDFRRYIRRHGSTTPPLTFNLRPRADAAWRIDDTAPATHLTLSLASGPLLSQVDCQHRLGHIGDLELSLPFMIFVGLNEREEMEVFNTINSKAKGLSSSLLDVHAAHLAHDLEKERPELFIALHLNESPLSPWHNQLDLGGNTTSGLKRRASLRTMQKAVRRFLSATGILDSEHTNDAASLVIDFWAAVAIVLPTQWRENRRHFLTKGVGVYALMGLLGDFWNEAAQAHLELTRARCIELLDDFAPGFDWSNDGPLKGLGGESGAQEALHALRHARATARSRLLANG